MKQTKHILGLALVALILAAAGCTSEQPALHELSEVSRPTTAVVSAESSAESADVSEASEASDASEESAAPTTAPTTTTTAAPTAAPTTQKPTTAAPTQKPTTKKPTTKKPTAADSESTTSKGYKITVRGGVTYVDGVMVANKTYSLPASYNPGGLTADCDRAYDKLKAGALKAGYSLYISSGFRTYGTQDILYNRYVANDGKANADRYSARPGHSEHQTGLAIDLNGVLDSFGDTATGKWVAAHCHEYGFILRYPKGKEAQTGYMYEPWHIRYVGVKTATAIYESGLCLEEYYGITSEYAD